jgi:hypothetical protein
MVTNDFNQTIDDWIQALALYNYAQLCAQPIANSWSVGQVYMHLIEATTYFIKQAKICLTTNDNAAEEMSDKAKVLFLNNTFPDALLEGPPSNARTAQPESKAQLIQGLLNLKQALTDITALLIRSPYKGKTKHPGLQYFNAHEWMQFAEMHFRHHLRQKQRIVASLKQ